MASRHILVVLVLLGHTEPRPLFVFSRTWSIMAKALADEGFAEKVTVRQAVKKVAWARKLPAYRHRFRLFSVGDSHR